jgi:hypothetical protein
MPPTERERLAGIISDFISDLDEMADTAPGMLPNRRIRRAHAQGRHARGAWLLEQHDARHEAWQPF